MSDAMPPEMPTETSTSAPASAESRAVRFPYLRLCSAIALTAGLIYPIGRTLVMGMLSGIPEARFGIATVVGLLVLVALTWNLAPRIPSQRLRRAIDWGVTILWCLLGLLLLWVSASDSFGLFVAGPLFLLSTIAVIRSGWIAFDLARWRQRLVWVLALLPLAALFPALIKVTGLTGAAQVQFAWRFQPKVDPGAQLPVRAGDDETRPGIVIEPRPEVDFPQYLGRDRTGVIPGVELAADWKNIPPRELWRREIGAGWSGFAVVGDYAFTQEQRGDKECVVCYALADGAEIWLHAEVARFESDMGGIGPRATPTVIDGTVYTVGGTGILCSLDAGTGRLNWKIDILADNGGHNIAHGVCGSPLVVGDQVIVCPTGMETGCLAAYNRQTGERLWHGGRHSASYGSPALVELAGTPQVVLVTTEGIEGADLKTGDSLWSYTWTNDVHVNCSQPIVVDAARGRILMCTGYTTGSVLLEVQPGGASGWTVREEWLSRGVMKTKFTTAVLHEGFVYGLDDGILACMDVSTGKQRWKGGRYKHGQLILAGDKLVIQAEDPGDVVLVRANSKKLEELGRIPALATMTWNNPALVGRKLLVRNNREAVCFELPWQGR